MTHFFAGCKDVIEIKKLYRELALRWHPDRPGGDTATMQEINRQYKEALKNQDRAEYRDEAGDPHTYYYNESREDALIAKIAEVIKSGILDAGDVELWLVGTWLWVMGNTYPHREKLGKKGLGFSWNGAANRKCWQWHTGGWKGSKSPYSFEELAARYGATRVKPQGTQEEELAVL